MIIKHGAHFFGKIYKLRKGLWAFLLDCLFRVLIGWADKLRHMDIFLPEPVNNNNNNETTLK